jgi:hypothetical protein
MTLGAARSSADVSAQGLRLCSLDDMYIDACDSLTHTIASGLCSHMYIVSILVVYLYQLLQGSAPVPKCSTRADRIGASTSLIADAFVTLYARQ